MERPMKMKIIELLCKIPEAHEGMPIINEERMFQALLDDETENLDNIILIALLMTLLRSIQFKMSDWTEFISEYKTESYLSDTQH